MPLLIGALACYLAINCSLGFLPRNPGGNLGLLPIDAAKAEVGASLQFKGGDRSSPSQVKRRGIADPSAKGS